MSREHVPSKDEPILESPKARNWGWGWGAMAGAFKDVSAGITKDVQELKESFRAAIRVDSDEENEDLGEDGVQTNLLRTHTHTSDATSGEFIARSTELLPPPPFAL